MLRVLFVDDVNVNNKILSRILRKELSHINKQIVIETKMVEDGLQALEIVFDCNINNIKVNPDKLNYYHIIFMDAQMPVINGYLATIILRKYGYCRLY